MPRFFIHPGTPVPIDGLCPACGEPALVEAPILRLTDSGVTVLSTLHACTECGWRKRPHRVTVTDPGE